MSNLTHLIMAKQKAFGLYTGKLGESVGYRNTNGKVPGQIAVRQYQANVANPKTAPQANQRMRMKPAINFYRGLASLLDHSWQGVKYGARSRAKFMELALSPTLEGIPFVDKGEARFIPGEYPLSLGQVTQAFKIDFENPTSEDTIPCLYVTDFDDVSLNRDITFGEVSSEVLRDIPWLQDGDELTFVFVYKQGDFFIPIHRYIVLDTNSLANAMEIMASAGVRLGGGNVNVITGFASDGDDIPLFRYPDTIVAAGIIVSRHPSKNSSTWLRSTSYMVVSDDFKAEWMSNERYQNALATYRDKAVSLTSDWLLNQSENLGNSGGLNPTTTYEFSTKSVTIGGTTAQMAVLSVSGAEAKPILMPYGSTCVYGTISGRTITFLRTNALASKPADSAYYNATQVANAQSAYTIDVSDISDEPIVEDPGV